MKENKDCIVVSAEMFIVLDELQQIPFLFPCDSFPRYRIIDYHGCQFKTDAVS